MTQHIIKKIFMALVFTCLAPNILAFTEAQRAILCNDITWWIFLQPNATTMTNSNFRRRLFEQLWEDGFFEHLGFDKSNKTVMYKIKSSILSTSLSSLDYEYCAALQEYLAKHFPTVTPALPTTKYVVWVALRSHTFKISHKTFLPLIDILIAHDSSTPKYANIEVESLLERYKETPIKLPKISVLDAIMERRMRESPTTDTSVTE